MLYESYLKVMAKGGSASIGEQSIEAFNACLFDNLFITASMGGWIALPGNSFERYADDIAIHCGSNDVAEDSFQLTARLLQFNLNCILNKKRIGC